MNKTALLNAINNHPARSAWDKAVNTYAYELIDEAERDTFEVSPELDKALLNGASDWWQYSTGGGSLIYDSDIAGRTCTPSELKRTDGGRLQPNSRESWLDVQARALYQAAIRINRIIRRYDRK